MDEKLIRLYEDINFIGYTYVCVGENNYVAKAKGLLPQIEEFVQWFLKGNQFGIEPNLYQMLQKNLLTILEDIAEAFKEEDTVLMMDALESGISEYLTIFMPKEYFEKERVRVYERHIG